MDNWDRDLVIAQAVLIGILGGTVCGAVLLAPTGFGLGGVGSATLYALVGAFFGALAGLVAGLGIGLVLWAASFASRPTQ